MGIKTLRKLINGPIYLCGPSGVGKTTIAKNLSDNFNLPMVDVSYLKFFAGSIKPTQSSMMEEARKITKEHLVSREYQFLTERAKKFKEASKDFNHRFISDRSYIDNLAFFILKASHIVPECEIQNFWDVCRRALFSQGNFNPDMDPGYIIYVPYTKKQINNGWEFENNRSRITNKYFQAIVGGIMEALLEYLKRDHKSPFIYHLLGMSKYIHYIPVYCNRVIPVLTIDTSRKNGNNHRQIKRYISIFLIIEYIRKWKEKRRYRQ